MNTNTVIIAGLSAGATWLAHDWAHQFYGANAEAVGNVGLVLVVIVLLGVAFNAMYSFQMDESG